MIVFVWTVLNSGHRMFPFKNFKNFKIPYTAALSKGAAEGGSGGSESPDKEHGHLVALIVVAPFAEVLEPSFVGRVLRRGPDVLATE